MPSTCELLYCHKNTLQSGDVHESLQVAEHYNEFCLKGFVTVRCGNKFINLSLLHYNASSLTIQMC